MVASFVQLPYYTIAPGDALDVNQLVTVHGARRYPPKGAVMLLFVRERSRVNGWRWLQASLDSDGPFLCTVHAMEQVPLDEEPEGG